MKLLGETKSVEVGTAVATQESSSLLWLVGRIEQKALLP